MSACHGGELVQMLQSQPGLGSTVMHVHTYDGRAQIAVNKNLLCFANHCVASGALTTL